MAKTKVLNIQLGHIWDDEKKKQVPVTLPAYEKKTKDGKTYFVLQIPIFVAEIEAKEKPKEETSW